MPNEFKENCLFYIMEISKYILKFLFAIDSETRNTYFNSDDIISEVMDDSHYTLVMLPKNLKFPINMSLNFKLKFFQLELHIRLTLYYFNINLSSKGTLLTYQASMIYVMYSRCGATYNHAQSE